MSEFDLFVIGAGSGGVRASRIAAAHGAKVAVAEEFRVGGTCVIRGCVPKKLLVYGAHFAEDLNDAAMFGWDVPKCEFSWPVLRDNVLAEVGRLEGLYKQTLDNHSVKIFHERAELTGPNSVRLSSGEEIRAKHILIATGARPAMPDIEGIEHAITSNETFLLEQLPKRIVIAGGGYIANEFAGIFHQFGSHVTIVNRSDVILRGYDEQIRDRLLQISLTKGIEFRFNSIFRKIEKRDDGSLFLTMEGCDHIEADAVLFATGRQPNVEGLGCEAAGIKVGEKGEIMVDEDSRTNVPSIYAVGDVTDRVQLTPVAIREGHAFADTVFGNKPWRVDYNCIPSAVFSHPPLAGVGMTEGQARNKLGSVRTYTSDFRPMKNVLAGRNERSLYKLVVDGSNDRVVGIHMIGPDAPEILQAAAIAVKAGLKKADFDATIALHPTMSEELVLMR
ncbi:glutathione-disulfide reductase [Sphingomonas alba]|uniref:Glutathione-disulfide reductase n=1 Tax=Sphingomonas alba TaxID=2908208 RepID=A0ABT0RK28_9SPHN|nr:glutathione-disulfide reductase [Sphingomonas alba]MCL6682997.1 glutathione-disulfide reductase [Sphingomonas alba]